MNNWIRLHEKDHVVIALRDHAEGERLAGVYPSEEIEIELQDDVPLGA